LFRSRCSEAIEAAVAAIPLWPAAAAGAGFFHTVVVTREAAAPLVGRLLQT